jgi:predicted porin
MKPIKRLTLGETKIAMALTLLLGAAGHAQAQSSVTLYGLIDTGIAVANHTGNGHQTVVKAQDSILGVSAVGFKGSEDLGGGLSAIFNLQMGFDPSNGKMDNPNSGLFDRNAYVGVVSKTFGTLTLGHQWNLNDDWLVGSVFGAGYNSGAPFKFHEFDAISEYYNNSVKYVSPMIDGLQGGLFYSVGGVAGAFSRGSVYDVGLRYTIGKLYIGGTYDQESSSSLVNSKYKLGTLAANYSFGVARVRLGYAHADNTGPGTFQSIISQPAENASLYEAGVDYFITTAFSLSGDYIYKRNATQNNHTSEYRLLASYSLSKRTSLIANLAYLKNSGGATEAMYNVDSPAAGTYGGLPDSGQTALTVGIRHLF